MPTPRGQRPALPHQAWRPRCHHAPASSPGPAQHEGRPQQRERRRNRGPSGRLRADKSKNLGLTRRVRTTEDRAGTRRLNSGHHLTKGQRER